MVAVQKVPRLDHVASRILEVDRAIAARVLDWAPHVYPLGRDSASELFQLARRGGECEVHVAPAAIAELLSSR